MDNIKKNAENIVDATNPDIMGRCEEFIDYTSPERWNEKVIIPAMLYVAQQQEQTLQQYKKIMQENAELISDLIQRIEKLENLLIY